METVLSIFALIWSVLCIILFFKIWTMTNDVAEIKTFLTQKERKQNTEFIDTAVNTSNAIEIEEDADIQQTQHTFKFSIGDIVRSSVFWGVFEIVGFNEDGTYKIKSKRTGEIQVGYEDTLKLK